MATGHVGNWSSESKTESLTSEGKLFNSLFCFIYCCYDKIILSSIYDPGNKKYSEKIMITLSLFKIGENNTNEFNCSFYVINYS